MIVTASRAWKPENGKSYGTVEVRMAPDFERDDAVMWGLVNAKGLTATTTFDLLRIVGFRDWLTRFDWLNWDPIAKSPSTHSWQQALGGSTGGQTALAGLHAIDCKRLHMKRLEVVGVPGPGALYQRTRIDVDSALLDRTGWPIQGDHDSIGGSKLHGIASRDHWWGNAWGPSGVGARAVSLRRLEPGCSARGELVVNEAGYELIDMTQQGDGEGWKCAGTQFRIAGYQGGPCFLTGTVSENLTLYPDPVRYLHLHESRGIVVEDSCFVGSPLAALQPRALLYISYPFTEPPVLRRCVFVKGRHLFVSQINWAAPHFEDCDFIGWKDATAAFELSPAYNGMPAASLDLAGCRFWES